MLRHVLLAGWAAAAAACGNPHGPAGPRPTAVPSEEAASLVAKADHELITVRALDYRAPRNLEPRWEAIRRATAFLYEACKRGDRPSCWRYFGTKHTDYQDRAHEIALELARHCQSGHELSCRALALRGPREYGFSYDEGIGATTRLCESGLAAACVGLSRHAGGDHPNEREQWLKKACDLGDAMSCSELEVDANLASEPKQKVEALRARAHDRARAECGQGYARSCALLFSRYDAGDIKRIEETAEESCRAGLVDECSILALKAEVRPELRAYGAEVLCTTQGDLCDILAGTRTEPSGIRDAYEHGCQLGDTNDCQELLKRYQARELPEPVPGRGAELARFLCEDGYDPAACAGPK